VSLNLVTGGAGFVGRHLIKALETAGERVRSFDLASGVTADEIVGSVTDPEAARRAVAGVDTVFHLAGNAQLWARDKGVFDKVNRGGTEVVISAAKAAGVRRFVHCSSLTTLVGRRTPKRPSSAAESTRLDEADMLGAYPRSKLAAERVVERAAKEGLDAVIALPTEPIGPGDESLTPPTRMILDFIRGATPAYVDCTLNFVPVKSLALGLIAARDRGRKGERYLLGGENIRLPALLAAISRATGRAMPRTRLPMAVAYAAAILETFVVAPATGRNPVAPLTGVRLAARPVSFHSEKAARDLGWRAAPFEPALAETIAWLRERGLSG
jgi:dihydroflavonol-4-reductase